MSYAYIGTYSRNGSEGIYRIEFSDGKARIVGSWPARDASYLAVKGDQLAAVYEGADASAVALYQIEPNGALLKLDEKPSGGIAPCYVSIDEDNVYTANYVSGEVGIYSLTKDEGELTDGQWIAHYGSGVNKSRQESSHAHCAVPVGPDTVGNYSLAVCDLGTDKVIFYRREHNNVSLPGYVVNVPPGTGPRHMVYIDKTTWAVIGELSCEVLVYNHQDEIVTRLPFARTMGDPLELGNTGSALKLSPDGSMLLATVRGENTIGVSRRVDGKFQPPIIVDGHGNWPRDASFSPDGQYVLAAMERSNEITIFKVTDEGLEFTSKLDIPTPTCICFPENAPAF
ncbi:hypothetical protein AGMMS49992_13760 [Clostridia bacterium]|nr:hypothetical protein AGMMS49992_13760 [Clostridia bacterium]